MAGTSLRDRLPGTDTSSSARERVELARERAAAAAEEARRRAEEAASSTRAAAQVSAVRAQELAGRTKERTEGITDSLGGLFTQIVAALSTLLSGASDTVRGAAARVAPPTAVRRRRKLRTAAWFAGGFAAGAATGWVLHARLRAESQPADVLYGDLRDGQLDESPYGRDAEAIDARRENLGYRRGT